MTELSETLFEDERITGWFANLYERFLACYANAPSAKGAAGQIKKFWYGLKWYRPEAIERAMKQAALKYSAFPTPQAIMDMIPEGSRVQAKPEYVETYKTYSYQPKTQAQQELVRELLYQEKALMGRLADLTWEYHDRENREFWGWRRTVWWPAYVEAGSRHDPSETREERERVRAMMRQWIDDHTGRLAKKMSMEPAKKLNQPPEPIPQEFRDEIEARELARRAQETNQVADDQFGDQPPF